MKFKVTTTTTYEVDIDMNDLAVGTSKEELNDEIEKLLETKVPGAPGLIEFQIEDWEVVA